MQRIDNIFFSPLGTYYVIQGLSADYENETWIYLTKTSETIGYVDGYVFAFSRDEKAVFSAEHASVAVWVMPTVRLRGHLHGHTNDIMDMDVSRDNQYLVTSSMDRTARIWSRQGGHTVHVLRGHEHYVDSVLFSPDGTFVATASRDNTIRTWSTQTGEQLHLFARTARTLEISPCSRFVIADGRLFETRPVFGMHDGEIYVHPVKYRAFSNDKRFSIFWSNGDWFTIFSMEGNMRSERLLKLSNVARIQWTPNDTLLMATTTSGGVQLRCPETGEVRKESKDTYTLACVSPDERRLLAAKEDNTVALIDIFMEEKDQIFALMYGPIGGKAGDGMVWKKVFSLLTGV